MNEKPTENEKHAVANTRGILMPAHQVREAIKQAVARGQLTEEEGEEIFWLYSYAQEYHLKEADLAAKMGAYDKNTFPIFPKGRRRRPLCTTPFA